MNPPPGPATGGDPLSVDGLRGGAVTNRRTRTPVRCRVRGCPFVGWWPEAGYCPEHQADRMREHPDAELSRLRHRLAQERPNTQPNRRRTSE